MRIILCFLFLMCCGFTSCQTKGGPAIERPIQVDSFYLVPCGNMTDLPERPITLAEIQAAHKQDAATFAECSKKQAGAAKYLADLSGQSLPASK